VLEGTVPIGNEINKVAAKPVKLKKSSSPTEKAARKKESGRRELLIITHVASYLRVLNQK